MEDGFVPKLDFQIPQTRLELDDSMITTQNKVDIPDLENLLSGQQSNHQHPSSPTKVSITTKSKDSRTEETEMKTN